MPSRPDLARRRLALALAAGLGMAAIPLPGAAPHAEPPEPLALTEEVADSIEQLDRLAGRSMPALEGRIVIVSFFASWCAPCIDEFAYLGRIYDAYGDDDPVIVAINLYESWAGDSDAARLRRFIDRTKPLFTVVRGDDEIAEMFGNVKEIPSLFVFDRRGRLVYRFLNRPENAISEDTEAQLHVVLNKLL
jgi:thiol-disulfide isomerase/thioredoxin